jgi:hypothetical protein
MTDRELLELAAKAAGDIEVLSYHHQKGIQIGTGALRWVQYWNPLTDDGEALRLAVQLKLEIYHAWDEVTQACVGFPKPGKHRQDISYVIESYDQSSIESATRRAIVRAAAEIGKANHD